jgi:hypothetical protein
VIDPILDVVVTNLPYSGLVCPDSLGGKVFYLSVSGSTGTLHAVNISTLTEVGSVNVPNISGSPSSLIRWGVDGLAFRTSGNQLFLIRTTFADDKNNDGMADSWEMANFGTLNVNPGDDPDHDGMSNLAEFIAGTDPKNANSVLHMTKVKQQAGGILLNWQAGTNVTYYVQRSQFLGSAAVWQDIFTNPPSATSTGGFTDTNASSAANYYRIRVWGP